MYFGNLIREIVFSGKLIVVGLVCCFFQFALFSDYLICLVFCF